MQHHVRTCLALVLGAAFLTAPLSSQAPSLDDVLKRAREAVARYDEQVALMLADEQCDQKAFEATQERSNSAYAFGGNAVRMDPRGRRKWQAVLATMRTPALASTGHPWTEFRDILEVDGRPLPDRADRLSSLFLDGAGWSLERAKAIAAESDAFAIGSIRRAVDTPAVPLMVLHSANVGRFSFDRTGDETVEGTKAWKIDFREQRAPTLISSQGGYCPAAGTLWVDPATGDVLRASLQCAPSQSPDAVNLVTVTYRRDPKLGVRVPVEMTERFEGLSGKSGWGGEGKAWVEGKCTYSNYRRFETAGKMIAVK